MMTYLILLVIALTGCECAATTDPTIGTPLRTGPDHRSDTVEVKAFDFERAVAEARAQSPGPSLPAEPVAPVSSPPREVTAADVRDDIQRRIKRWAWESPAKTRARLWAVPEEESNTATATALLRVCVSEADWDGERDCVGIWEVTQNVRSRACRRESLKRITECDENGETNLSALRRLQRVVLGMVHPRSRRSRWISELELSCDEPPSYPYSSKRWARSERPRCSKLVKLVRSLVNGRPPLRVTRGRAIAWGGRCEDELGACDDPLACRRRLARIPNTQTRNAFWCRVGSPGCRRTIEPICVSLGFGNEPARDNNDAEGEAPELVSSVRGCSGAELPEPLVADGRHDGQPEPATELGPVLD